MHPVLNRNSFLFKAHNDVLKKVISYDVYDPGTRKIVMTCREELTAVKTALLRSFIRGSGTSFDVWIRTPDGQPVVRVRQVFSVLIKKVNVYDELGAVIGGFKGKLLSLRPELRVLDANDRPQLQLKATDLMGTDFNIAADGQQLARITHKYSGAANGQFSSEYDYLLKIEDNVPSESLLRQLIVGAVICIDVMLK